MPLAEVTQLGIAELIGWAISLLGIFTTIVFGLVKLLLGQMEKRMTERDAAQENAFSKMMERQDKDAEALRNLENSFLRFQADLPLHYVRREDYVRNQTVIEAKLDALASKLEVIQIRGKAHD